MSKPDPRSETDKAARPLGGLTGKTCAKCGQDKVWTYRMGGKHGARSHCSSCHRLRNARWARNNTDKVSEWNKRFFADRPGYTRPSDGKWARDNPDKNRAKRAMYQAQLKGAILPGVPYDQYGKHEGKDCYVCGDPAQATDHVHPLNKGGAHCNTNFKPICQPCNSSKLDRTYPGHSSWETFLSSRRA